MSMSKIEELEHDGEMDSTGVQPKAKAVPVVALSEEQQRRLKAMEAPSKRREALLNQHRSFEHDWMNPENPALWVGDRDDD